MPDLEVEDFYESDSSEDNEENHSKLLSSVAQLDSTQRVKPASRKEVTSEVSEFNLTESSRKNRVNVKELAQLLGRKANQAAVTKKFKKVTAKAKTLPKPLEKPVEERVKRAVGFENVKKQLKRWDAVVARNALKDQISFPLNDNSMKMQRSNEFLHQFKASTPLEEEIAKVLKKEKMPENEENADEFPLTLEEMMEKRKEMAQLRAKLSYREAKAHRQSKIKSKKYHRILKHEKLRQQLKEFELLQKTDPEAALKKLTELDKTRAQERASLRHRNTGQWAKNLTVRAKYDVESRKVLAEQLKMSRELTQKVHIMESSDEEELAEPAENAFPSQNSDASKGNPWTLDVSKEVQEFVSGYKKYWSEKCKEEESKKNGTIQSGTENHEQEKIPVLPDEAVEKPNTPNTQENTKETKEVQKTTIKQLNGDSPQRKSKIGKKRKKSSVNIHPGSGVWIVTPVTEENTPDMKKKKTDDIDSLFEKLDETLLKEAKKKVKNIKRKLKKHTKRKKEVATQGDSKEEFDLTLKNKAAVERPDLDTGLLEGGEDEILPESTTVSDPFVGKSNAAPEIDPKNFIKVKPKRLSSHLPENITGGDDALDDEEVQQMAIREAFGDDDVIAEFKELKEQEEKSNQVEIETSLPGWGEWGGKGINPKKKKKRLLVINLPQRKDKTKVDVIINENENPKLKDHLVKEVPHPFTSVDAFEANIRAPVGRDWVPETAHRKLIQKQVVTKLGAIIEPMDEDEIIRLEKAPKSPYQGKKKNKETR